MLCDGTLQNLIILFFYKRFYAPGRSGSRPRMVLIVKYKALIQTPTNPPTLKPLLPCRDMQNIAIPGRSVAASLPQTVPTGLPRFQGLLPGFFMK